MIFRVDKTQSIPLADAHGLGRHARRTALVRIALAAMLLAALAVEVSFGRETEKRRQVAFPGAKSGVVVLDVSASIGLPGPRFTMPLRHLAETRQDFGLVLFSDTAYEAIPPGTESAELTAFIRRFSPPAGPCRTPPGWSCPPGTRRMSAVEARKPRMRPEARRDPWLESFRGGTRISTGLSLARAILEREGMTQRGVLLVSDLNNSFFDLPSLNRELIEYRRAGIPLHIVALSPFRDDRSYFRQLLGSEAFVDRADIAQRGLRGGPARETSSFPVDLVLVGLIVLLLLGANEHYCGRLTWGRTTDSGSGS